MSRLPKSTIVRFRASCAPGDVPRGRPGGARLAGRIARDIWFTVPPRMPPTRLPGGGEPFEVESLGAAVRGHVWGTGPAVYLVHGWGGRGSQLASFVEPLLAGGFRVVMFDAPAHGDSDPGPAGPGRTHGVEFGKALDAVFARFGPAEAVVAHSLGAISTYLTLRFGWLSTRRLVLLAPMVAAEPLFDQFQRVARLRSSHAAGLRPDLEAFVGVPMAEFDAVFQASHLDPVPTLVVHDRGDRQTPYADAVRLVASLPDARLVTTDGLGHRRILRTAPSSGGRRVRRGDERGPALPEAAVSLRTVPALGTVPGSPLAREAPTYAGTVSIQQQVTEAATRARTASRVLALATRAEKDAALTAIADALTTHEATILAANAEDLERAESDGTSAGIIDRLRLDGGRIAAHGRRPAAARRAARPGGRGGPRRHPGQRAGAPAAAGAVRRRRDDLRGPSQRHRGRSRHLPQVRQRGAPARFLQRPAQQRGARRRDPRTRSTSSGCRPTSSSWCPATPTRVSRR